MSTVMDTGSDIRLRRHDDLTSPADFFLKIDGVDGESADDKHAGEIELLQFGWAETQMGTAGTGGGAGAGKAQKTDLWFVKKIDKSSPVLFIACATGKHYKTAVLTVRKAGGEQQDYLKFTMEQVLVSQYHTTGSPGAVVLPLDSVSLNFEKLEISYKVQEPDGKLGAEIKQKYDFGKNVKA